MDAARLRQLVDAALAAQKSLDDADTAKEAAHAAREKAAAVQRVAVGNLKAVLNSGFVLYGDVVVRIGLTNEGQAVYTHPLHTLSVLAPPPPPMPEVEPVAARQELSSLTKNDSTVPTVANEVALPVGSVPVTPIEMSRRPIPTSGGTIPALGKKGHGTK
jgi:hypothetical protein